MRWMNHFAEETRDRIIAQERWNYDNFGVGNGMAQSYNHCILPLANLQDKITQVRWGIKDFELHFGHAPVGMWLPETAADTATLCVLSDNGIQFTILAPWQVKPEDGAQGPYLVELPGGREPFVVFSYDQELSTRVSFHPSSTENGDLFLESILSSRQENPEGLILVASDGELYGHHQPFRDLFLSYVLNGAAEKEACSGPTRANGLKSIRSSPGRNWQRIPPGLVCTVWTGGKRPADARRKPIGKPHSARRSTRLEIGWTRLSWTSSHLSSRIPGNCAIVTLT